MKNKAFKIFIITAVCGAMIFSGCAATTAQPAAVQTEQSAQQSAEPSAKNSAEQPAQTVPSPDVEAVDDNGQTQNAQTPEISPDFYNDPLTGDGSLNNMTFMYGEDWTPDIDHLSMTFTMDGADYPYLKVAAASFDELGLSDQEIATLTDGKPDAVRDTLEIIAAGIAAVANSGIDDIGAADIGGLSGIKFQYNMPDDELLIVGAMATYEDYCYTITLGVPMGFAGSSMQPYDKLFTDFLNTVKFE